jgi:hypothetical protein
MIQAPGNTLNIRSKIFFNHNVDFFQPTEKVPVAHRNDPGVNVIKLFSFVADDEAKWARVLVPGKSLSSLV